jgi:hypothetical protein
MANLDKHDEIIEKIIEKPSECSFDKEQKQVCSPDPIIHKMMEFVKTKTNIEVPKNPVKILEVAKEITDCNSESCILKQPEFIKFAKINNVDNILEEFFKPNGPATHFGLLSNFNIDEVLDQLTEKFPDFLHIPFQMRDFEKIGSELATLDLAKEFKHNNIKRFGVVLNTDYSVGKGIHWYCLYGEYLGNKIILEYFNSSGREPLVETHSWLQKQKHYLTKSMNIPVEIKYSTGIQFQNDEHSCGVYCLMYIWFRLEGVSAGWFKSNNFNDNLMHKSRKLLFRHEV